MKCRGKQYNDERIGKESFNIGRGEWECLSLREVLGVSGLRERGGHEERTLVLSMDVRWLLNVKTQFVFS